MRILVSAGPTREYFDSVRFISNPSTGKMGYAIAEAARDLGHEVTLVSGPVSLKPPSGVNLVAVITAAEMLQACKRAFQVADAAVMTAAVCDYRPAERAKFKIPKFTKKRAVSLEPTQDIAAALGRRKKGRVLIGFAMEDARDPHGLAERKLKRKNCDLIVLNGPANIGSDQATVEYFSPSAGWSSPVTGSKRQTARRLVRMIESMLDERSRHVHVFQPVS